MANKGSSPIIAIPLLIAIVVGASVIVHGWVQSYMSQIMESVPQEVWSEELIPIVHNEDFTFYQNTLQFEGNRTIVISLGENETITFLMIVKEGALNFTFGLLKETELNDINYVTNLVPEYQTIFNEANLITQISFRFTTYQEGLYGFSMESNRMVILDVYLSEE